jgi:hypothetical protein
LPDRPLADTRTAERLEFHLHAPPERRRDVHQRIEREPRDASAQQIVDAWLRDSAALGRLDLLPAFGLDQLGNLSGVSARASRTVA